MTLDLTELKKIKSSDTNLIFGYFREAHKQLSSQNNPYYDLQPLIVYTCLAFYHIKHEWDTETMSHSCVVNGDFIENTENRNTTSVLKEAISNGIHEFKFKIINYDHLFTDGYYDTAIGIISSEYFAQNTHVIIHNMYTDPYPGFGYYASIGIKDHAGWESEYGIKCELNDIVTMTVDLENHKIRYKVNEEDYGIAFDDIPQDSYRIALYLSERGSKVQIIT